MSRLAVLARRPAHAAAARATRVIRAWLDARVTGVGGAVGSLRFAPAVPRRSFTAPATSPAAGGGSAAASPVPRLAADEPAGAVAVALSSRLERGTRPSARGIVALLSAAKAAAGFRGAELGVRVVPAATMARLNARFRGRAGPTDVLSFAAATWRAPEELEPGREEGGGVAGAAGAAGDAGVDESPLDLGDVIVAASVVASDAAAAGDALEARWRLVLVHSLLHLLGHDHEREADAAAMEAREAELLAATAGGPRVAPAVAAREDVRGPRRRARRGGGALAGAPLSPPPATPAQRPLARASHTLASPVLLPPSAALGDGGRSAAHVFVDVSGGESFLRARIPGAVALPAADPALRDARSGRALPGHAVAAVVAAAGLREGDVAVLYDGGGGALAAARAWWVLALRGVRAAVLDGGLRAYADAGGSVETGAAPRDAPTARRREGAPVALHPDASLQASADDVAAAVATGGAQVIDARTRGEFEGLDLRGNPRGGRVPGALCVPHAGLLAPSGRLRARDELAAAFAAAGVDVRRPSIVYCQSGVRAALAVLALRVVAGGEGAARVAHYDGAMREWLADPSRPVE